MSGSVGRRRRPAVHIERRSSGLDRPSSVAPGLLTRGCSRQLIGCYSPLSRAVPRPRVRPRGWEACRRLPRPRTPARSWAKRSPILCDRLRHQRVEFAGLQRRGVATEASSTVAAHRQQRDRGRLEVVAATPTLVNLPATLLDRRSPRRAMQRPCRSLVRRSQKNRWLDRRSSAYDFDAIMTNHLHARPMQRAARRAARSPRPQRRSEGRRCDRERLDQLGHRFGRRLRDRCGVAVGVQTNEHAARRSSPPLHGWSGFGFGFGCDRTGG